MQIETKYAGRVDVNESDIITFDSGLPGFDNERRFVILPFTEESPFFILQSVETARLAFVVMEPFFVFKEYDFELDDKVITSLKIKSEKDVSVFVIVTVSDPFAESTANLQAPLIINQRKKYGKQIILNDSRYHTKHRLSLEKTAVEKRGGPTCSY